MATIKLCDYTKKRLAANEATFKLVLNGKEYEISASALQEIQTRLDSDEAPPSRVVATKPIKQTTQPEHELLNVEAPSPFGGKTEPGLLDDTPRPSAPPIAIPASTKERLPLPTVAQVDAVVAESTRFSEGTLTVLTPGKHRNMAQQKLAAKEATFEDNQRPVPDRGRRGE